MNAETGARSTSRPTVSEVIAPASSRNGSPLARVALTPEGIDDVEGMAIGLSERCACEQGAAAV